jgi:(1->4)-alpha-D-glucan 1-alpha-D-glucosylmutase
VDSAEAALARTDEGAPKQWLIRKALGLRKRMPETFGGSGTYEALYATGQRSNHVVAFSRGGRVISISPRLVWSLGDDWRDTTLSLPEGRWVDELTGAAREGTIGLGEMLTGFPVALLVRD